MSSSAINNNPATTPATAESSNVGRAASTVSNAVLLATEPTTEASSDRSRPQYPHYPTMPTPSTVNEMIIHGRNIIREHKSKHPQPVRPLPKPAQPRSPKVTDVKMSRRAMLAHARCLRRNNAVLTDRLELMSRPLKRRVVYLWREHGHVLPPEAIARFRRMLDADDPFMPDQAYQYFVNLRRMKSQKRRNKNMQRISNIILRELCKTMNEPMPRDRCQCRPRAKFMIEMADKASIWMDEILRESDYRMLIMDHDEDDEVIKVLNEEKHKEPEATILSQHQLVERGLELTVSQYVNRKKSELKLKPN